MPKPKTKLTISAENSSTPAVEVEIEDVGPEMAVAFQGLYAHHYLHQPMDWNGFHTAAVAYFDTVRGDSEGHSAYFNNFTRVWVNLLNKGQTEAALRIWPRSLEPAYAWEANHPSERIHKGSPYYFWGGTAVLVGDLDLGFLLVHQAFEEDKLDTALESPDLPAWKFVALEDTSPQQLFRPVVTSLAEFVAERIATYNQQCGGNLTLEAFKQKLLRNTALQDPAFYFVYALSRARRLLQIDPHLKDSVFAPLLQLNALLDFYMVLESVLQAKFPAFHQIAPLVTQFSVTYGYTVHQADASKKRPKMEIVKVAFETDPAGTLVALVNNTFAATQLTSVEAALAVAPPMRNYGAHKIESQPVFTTHFAELLQLSLNSIFVTIECAY
jgi:hypothetical protein